MGRSLQQPPRWADNFLQWFCDTALIEEIQGDLHESFHRRCRSLGRVRASVWFVIDVLRSMTVRNIGLKFPRQTNYLFRNHVLTSIRKLRRRKVFALINITGLSVSLAGALLISLYVREELQYDQFHRNLDRIYRVYCAYAEPGEAVEDFAYTPPNFVPTARVEIAGIEAATRVFEIGQDAFVQYDDRVFQEKDFYQVDSSFFRVFTATFLVGQPKFALSQPYSIVLTRTTAEKYFGTPEDALQKVIDIDTWEKKSYTITAVVEDYPGHSHFRFGALMSIDYANENLNPQNWLSHWPVSYILLHDGANATEVQDQVRRMTERILEPIYVERFGKSYSEQKKEGRLQEYRFQPLDRVHLYSAHMGEAGSIYYVYVFISIAFLLICLAIFNYINLSTARTAWEAKGAGIRKVLGATRGQLQRLALTESLGVALVACLVAVLLAQFALLSGGPFLQQFIPDKTISADATGMALGVAAFTGLLAGWVPARLLAAFQPTAVIKGQLSSGRQGSTLRQSLVVLQFTVSMALVMCSMLMTRQLDYVRDKDLGFNREEILIVKNVDKLGDKKELLKDQLLASGMVINASLCYGAVGNPGNSAAFTPVELINENRMDITVDIPIFLGDEHYLSTLGVKLLMGHTFPPDLPKERQQIILNREALRAVGWQDRAEKDIVGKMIDVNGLRYELAGIVDDYHFRSLHQPIGPMAILSHYYQGFDMLMLRLKPGVSQAAINATNERWSRLAPELPFAFGFLDVELDRLYAADNNLGRLLTGFTGVAIFIACLGLLGLSMFAAERSVKEIGIRKVLGATVVSIVLRLSRNTVTLVILSFAVAAPLAWWIMNIWLTSFAYRIPAGPAVFVLSGVITLVIAFLTISIQAGKAALANPVDALRHE